MQICTNEYEIAKIQHVGNQSYLNIINNHSNCYHRIFRHRNVTMTTVTIATTANLTSLYSGYLFGVFRIDLMSCTRTDSLWDLEKNIIIKHLVILTVCIKHKTWVCYLSCLLIIIYMSWMYNDVLVSLRQRCLP